jgi:5-deoxy-glucuronate isomerase
MNIDGVRTGVAPNRQLLRRPSDGGTRLSLDPESAGWSWLSVNARRLVAGQALEWTADRQERLVIVLEGHASVVVGDRQMGVLGSRESVFDGPPPPLVLVAPGQAVSLRAETNALIVVGAAPGGAVERTARVDPADILVETRGGGRTERRIHHLLPPAAEAGRLIAFEAFTPGGNWSSYPPHKHDTEDPPTEAYLEEVYLYRFARPGGFALQRIYTPDRTLDISLAPADLDLVLVPSGYHVVAAAPGYDCYYLNLMAGPNRAWHFTVDPDQAWLMDWDPSRPKSENPDSTPS